MFFSTLSFTLSIVKRIRKLKTLKIFDKRRKCRRWINRHGSGTFSRRWSRKWIRIFLWRNDFGGFRLFACWLNRSNRFRPNRNRRDTLANQFVYIIFNDFFSFGQICWILSHRQFFNACFETEKRFDVQRSALFEARPKSVFWMDLWCSKFSFFFCSISNRKPNRWSVSLRNNDKIL